MKKTLALFVAILMLASSFIGCEKKGASGDSAETTGESAAERLAKYEAAVKALEDDVLTEDGTYAMSEDLITALEYAEFTEPKNIIYMIGDGMGFNQILAAEAAYADVLYNGRMAWRYLPMVSSQTTSSADAKVTDSAAGGSALATGYRTANGVVAMNTDATESYKTVLELAAEKGKSTGIVATKEVTDATPAAFTAHVSHRSEELEIASQQADKFVDGTLDIALGGGAYFYDRSRDNIPETLANAGVTYTKDFAEASAAELPLVGLFADETFDTTDPEIPTIAEMTSIALDKLSKDENGFFIMIEGSQIDSGGHSSDFEYQTREAYDFDCAIAVALRFVAMNPDTVIIVTADHETGGLVLPESFTSENVKDVAEYTSDGGHTHANVPVLAIGHGVEALDGINYNTDCARFVASLLGEENFGQDKKIHTLLDMNAIEDVSSIVVTNSYIADAVDGGISVKFDSSNSKLVLPIDEFNVSFKEFELGARTIVVKYKNIGDTAVKAPVLTANTPKTENILEDTATWLRPGETTTIVYAFETECWSLSRLRNLKEMFLTYEGEAALEIYDIMLTERAMDK